VFRFLVRVLLLMLTLGLVAHVIPGIKFDGYPALFLAALVLGLANALLRPLLIFFTLPLVLLSLGLFIVVINACLLYFVAWVVPGFHVGGFLWTLLAAVVISVVSFVLNRLFLGRKKRA
jgi:putative membrane protein